MSKHTPGPWEQDGLTIRANHRGVVALCPTPQHNGTFDCNYNARLIAAAPELLEALTRIAKWFKNQPGSRLEDLPDDFILAAIAKAEGHE